MLAVSELRRFDVFHKGEWKTVQSMGQIEKFDHFRIYEPDGTPVVVDGKYVFVAVDQAFLDADAVEAEE